MTDTRKVNRFGREFVVPSDWDDAKIDAKINEWRSINDKSYTTPTRKEKDYSYTGNLARSAGQGALFNFGDEAEAGIRSILPGGRAYDQELADIRKSLKDFEEDNPITSFGANLAGSVAVPASIAKLPFSSARLARMSPLMRYGVAAPVTGALSGALSGFGGGSEDIMNRLDDAALGGSLGLVAGALASPIVEGGSRAVKSILRHFRSPDRRAADIAARAATHDLPNSADIGDDIMSELANLRRSGVPPRMSDASPGLTDLEQSVVARSPGEGRDIVESSAISRLRGVDDRVLRNIEKRIHPDTDAWLNINALGEQRAKDAGPMYKKAYDANVNIDTENLRNLYNRIPDEIKRAALKRGAQLYKLETGEDLPQLAAFITDGAGNVKDLKMLEKFDTKTFDWFKRGLDSQIAGLSADANERSLASKLRQVKNKMLEEVDTVNPDYGKARGVWSGPSHEIDVINMGKDAFNIDPREIADTLKGLSPHDQDLYKLGFASNLRARLEGTVDSANKAEKLLNRQDLRDRVKYLIGDSEFEKMEKYLEAEAKTARRDAKTVRESSVGEGVPREDLGIVARYGNIPVTKRGWVQRVLQYITDNETHAIDPNTRKELANLLVDPSVSGQRKAADRITKSAIQREKENATARALGLGAAGAAGHTFMGSELDDAREEGDPRRGYAEGGKATDKQPVTVPTRKEKPTFITRDPEEGDPRRGYAEGGLVDEFMGVLKDIGLAVGDDVSKRFKEGKDSAEARIIKKYNPLPHSNELISNILGGANVVGSFVNPFFQYDDKDDTPLSRGVTDASNLVSAAMGPAALPGKAMYNLSKPVLRPILSRIR